MDRTTGADWVDIGGGKRGFRDQNRAAGIIGTEVNAAWLNAVQEELLAVILSEGIVPDSGVLTQLLAAIDAKIEAVRVAQPIYPDVLTVDGKFTVTQTAPGVVSVAAGTTWTMRGGKQRTSVLTPLATAASKVYHLRYRNDAFGLYDIASLVYNPLALPETDKSFDSDYDDMLVARVVTNGANVATITTLANKAALSRRTVRSNSVANATAWTTFAGTADALNWARTPVLSDISLKGFRSHNHGATGAAHAPSDGKILGIEARFALDTQATRYGYPDLEYYYEDDAGNDGWLSIVVINQA